MAEKIRHSTVDLAIQELFLKALTESGDSYREIQRNAHDQITYNRIRDIVLGQRGPMRITELLILCQALDLDPVETFQRIITRAKEMGAETMLLSA